MPKEKKPRNPTSPKGSSAKKAAVKPTAETAPFDTASAVPVVKAAQTTKSRTQAKSSQVNPQINPQPNLEEAIRFRAYEIYLQRGGMPGNPREDWAVAEREVLSHFGQDADA